MSSDLIERQYKKLNMSMGGLNTDDERILENVRSNIRRQLPQAKMYEVNHKTMCIVGGGWSLDETFDELRELYFSGAKICTVNNSAKWCLERNIKPSAHVVMDARPGNARFVDFEDVPGLKFFLASQCDPSLFDMVEGKDTYIMHVVSTSDGEERKILDEYYCGGNNWGIVGGTTCVGFRAIGLLRMLGFYKFHLFGIDSCYPNLDNNDNHHAYPQKENDGETTGIFTCGGREFRASGWQIAQATTFRDLVKHNGDLFNLNVHGDGLIAHMIKTAAEIKEKNNGCDSMDPL